MKKIILTFGMLCLLLQCRAQDKVFPSNRFEVAWEAMEPLVFEYNVKVSTAFSKTVQYFTSEYLHDRKWHYHARTTTTENFTAKSEANVLIEGNCTSKIKLPYGGIIHIKGDLTGELDVMGQSEIIIAGGISSGALIKTDGIVDVLVGADVNGKLVNIGSSDYFVMGNLNGHIVTGYPSTDLHVYGDCNASFAHYGERGSMLRLVVGGYMSSDKIDPLQKLYYTSVKVFIQESDSKRGILPTYGHGQSWYVRTNK